MHATASEPTQRRSHLAIVLLLWASVVVGTILGPSVARADDTICTATTPLVVDGNLIVVPGPACTLAGHTITGNLIVTPGGHLNARDIYVGGNVWADGADAIFIDFGSEIVGDVQATNGARVSHAISSSTVGGDIEFTGIDSGNIGSSSNTVGGNIKFEGNRVTDFDLINNTVGQDLQFFNNNAPSGIFGIVDNRIHGNLQCENNDPDPTGAGNTVGGNKEGECALFLP
jgi:hypothetical protein